MLDFYVLDHLKFMLYWSFYDFLRYPGTTFMDHIMRYQENPDVKMMVVLGEVSDSRSHVIRVFSTSLSNIDQDCKDINQKTA